MQYQNAIRELPVEDFFGKKLTTDIQKWNTELADLQGKLAEIPQRRATLTTAVHEATISGSDAVQERRQIAEDEIAAQIDMAAHVKARAAFDDAVRDAYRKEAEKLTAAADARRDAVVGQVGDLLSGELKNKAVQGDAAFSGLRQQASAFRQAATVGVTKGPHSAQAWLSEFQRNMASTFGQIPATPGSHRTVEVIGGPNHGKSMFK